MRKSLNWASLNQGYTIYLHQIKLRMGNHKTTFNMKYLCCAVASLSITLKYIVMIKYFNEGSSTFLCKYVISILFSVLFIYYLLCLRNYFRHYIQKLHITEKTIPSVELKPYLATLWRQVVSCIELYSSSLPKPG